MHDDLVKRANEAMAGEPLLDTRARFLLPAMATRIEALTAERDALKAARVKVKPLVWEAVNEDGRIQDAKGFNSVYRVWLSKDGVARWQAKYMSEWINADSLDAAKAAAQADYEARILAALELTPDTSQIDAIRAALDAAPPRWRLIADEPPPDDGRDLLLHQKGWAISPVIVGRVFDDTWLSDCFEIDAPDQRPTHWMPLPEAPQ